jgi:sugar transferase (PEP-CTERM/EpsH1 system associated)
MVSYLDLPELAGVPTVVDLCDVDSQKFLDYASHTQGLKRQLYLLEGRRTRRIESSLPDRVRAITLVSKSEADLYRSFCPNNRTLAVTNGVDFDYYQPVATEGRPGRCVFVGAMDYPPNIQAAVWFCQHVWPRFRAAHPQATFAIVGRNPHPAVRRLAEVPGVEVIGSVPDVRPHVALAEVAVVPLQIARGVQNKVLEAMAMARPVIASPQALEGLAVEAGVHAALASSPTDWLEQLESLASQANVRRQLAAAGRTYVEQHHSWQACLQPLETCLELTTAEAAAAA